MTVKPQFIHTHNIVYRHSMCASPPPPPPNFLDNRQLSSAFKFLRIRKYKTCDRKYPSRSVTNMLHKNDFLHVARTFASGIDDHSESLTACALQALQAKIDRNYPALP